MSRKNEGASVRFGPRTAYLLRVRAATLNRSLKDVASEAIAELLLRGVSAVSPEVAAFAATLSDDAPAQGGRSDYAELEHKTLSCDERPDPDDLPPII